MSRAVWNPDPSFIESTRLFQWMQQLGFHDYAAFFDQTIRDPAWFWREVESILGLEWFHPYDQVLDLSGGVQWPRWYVGGQQNVVHNAIDKWALHSDSANRPALIWENEEGKTQCYTFREIHDWVARVAQGLIELGIQAGDRISIYLPMRPEIVVSMLAAAKIGVIFSPIFSGYGAEAVSARLNAAQAKLLITADVCQRRGKFIAMKEEADRAVEHAPTVEHVVVVRQTGCDIPWQDGRDIEWNAFEKQTVMVSTASLPSDAPLMILYTSGTTGKPKGALHTHTGFPLKAAFDAGICMDVKREDILFWVTDMGWMMGPFMIFGALLNGAAALLYDGSPDYPIPERLWQVVSKHRVTHLGISPTFIRSQMQHQHKGVDQSFLSHLRVIGSTGEPWNPDPWLWLFQTIGQGKIPIFNYSGGTEISGGILGNILIQPIAPVCFNSAIPGMDADVVNDNGYSVLGEVGELVIRKPWVGMTHGFWQEPERYEETYWGRFTDTWVHGDWAIRDEDGFWTITGRSDDTLKVAGKRIGPAEIESVLVSHPLVVEAVVIGVPDKVKGEAIVCFVMLIPTESSNSSQTFSSSEASNAPEQTTEKELLDYVSEKMGKVFQPKAVHTISMLPKTRNGKIMRRVVKRAYLNEELGDLSALENTAAVEEIRMIGSRYN